MIKYTTDNAIKAFKEPIFKDNINDLFNSFPTQNIYVDHKDFITEWLFANDYNFTNFNQIIELINLTTNYIKTKNNNSIKNIVYVNNGTTNKNKTLSELAARNIKRLKIVKEDLESLTIHGGKTKNLINEINDFISNTSSYIPTNKCISKCNVENIRGYLKKHAVNNTSIDEYIKYLQNLKTIG